MASHTDGKPPAEALAECEEKVEQLREENAALRHSAQTFGDLAERLNRNQRAKKRPPPKQRRLASKG